ncbi:MAG TPA: hypothetical protein PK907_06435 [Candidatus Sabulitectum sp.]|nr:hypothetical protein [Candidatus Sabulitectum sp.]
MRKQYHFRQSERGLIAWDVHRLIELSSGLPVHRIPLESISELDEVFWYDLEGDRPTCRSVALHARLMEEVDLAHPIILSSDGRVMDGMHRVCRALVLGLDSVPAVRFPSDPDPDHVGVAPDELPYDEEQSFDR